MIKDSGQRTEFKSGAVRDVQEGKGRFDLVPLDVAGKLLKDDVLIGINQFVRNGYIVYLYGALGKFAGYENLTTLLLEVAKHFEEGAKKYQPRNWEKGIPLSRYVDSMVRHYLKWLRGDDDEPHDRAFCWNVMCCIWTCENKPEMNDLPWGNKDV